MPAFPGYMEWKKFLSPCYEGINGAKHSERGFSTQPD